MTVTVTIQLEGFLTLKEVEEEANVSTPRAHIKKGQAGFQGPNLQTALQVLENANVFKTTLANH